MTAASARSWWHDPLEIAREATLLGLNLAAVVSLSRLFAGGDHLAPLLTTAAVAHTTLMLVRRSGRSLAVAAVVAPIVALITTSVLFAGSTTLAGVPTGETFDALQTALDEAFGLFGEAPTPTEPIDGFLIVACAALWVSAFVADWAAFRLSVPFEALLPSATVFVFGAVLADGRQQGLATTVALVAGFSFLLVARVAGQAARGTWVSGATGRGSAAMALTGAVILVAAIVAASVGGPTLPGAGSEAIVELEPRNDAPRSWVTVSPLVDIRRRLVSQADVEVFSVRSDARAYWRLTSLDTFDGRIWSSSGSYGKADGTLPSASASPPSSTTSAQQFSINALAAIWLPAAFEPTRVDSPLDVRFDELSSTLIVDTDIEDSDGLSYSVESALPTHDPAALDAAGTQYPQEILDTHLALPGDLPESVRALASQVSAGATTPYQAARQLQDFLRTFRYDLTAPDGHTGDDLERFLIVDQAGYCEQFAGAFAAMARSLNIPARVAVGFTPGIEVEPGTFSVRGEHAHVWPEVYFPDLGWVPFEPTPNRGAPGAESHTGVPEQQVESNTDGSTATTVSVPDQAADETAAEPADATPADTPEPGTEAPPDPREVVDDLQAEKSDAVTERLAPVIRWAGPPFLLVVFLAMVYAVVALALARQRRARRRANAEQLPDRVTVAWQESIESLNLVGVLDAPDSTHRETAAVAAQVSPRSASEIRELGRLAETAVYGPSWITEDDVQRAELASASIADSVRESTTVAERGKHVLDPATVFGLGPFRRIGRE